MATEHLWVAPGEIVTDISGHVELPKIGQDGFQLQTYAEEGSVGSSDLTLDDPAGSLYITGLNAYRVRETLSDADDPYLFIGAFGRRKEKRGPYMTGANRQISAQLQDANSILSRFVVKEDEDPDRPQESEEDRMTWLFTTSGMTLHFDFATSILDLGSTVMPAGDLTGYTPQQIIGEMATMTGKNFYVFIDGSVDPPEAWLVYAHDSGDHLTSDLRFSNVETDVDDSTTFAAGLDWEQDINPEQVTSNATVRGANGLVTVNDDDTAAEFSRVDRVFDANLIKTDALLTEQALTYLNELDTEQLVVSGTVYLPAAKASQFRAGMRCEMKATHLTGMSDFVWVRLLNVTIVNIAEDPTLTYALAFEGTRASTAPVLTCGMVSVSLTGQVSGPITGTTGLGGSLTPGGGSGLMVAGCAVGENGTALWGPSGELLAAAAGWSEGTSRPQSDTHTGSNLGWKADAGTGSPAWGFVGNPAQDGRQVGMWIPGATFVQSVSGQTAVNITSGDIDWPSPLTPGNMVVIFGVAEGPTGWGGDITKNDVTPLLVIEDINGALEHPGSNVRMAVGCVDPGDTFQPNSAGSSWWFHAIEVSF